MKMTKFMMRAYGMSLVLMLIVIGCITPIWAIDATWAAPNGTGRWADANWLKGGSMSTFDNGSTAYFNLPVNNIDLGGGNFGYWTFRTDGSFASGKPCSVNIYNTSSADSMLTFLVTDLGNNLRDMSDISITFGGASSIGKVKIFNDKDKNNSDRSRTFRLKRNGHLVFATNSEYTENKGYGYNYIGETDAFSNSVTILSGALVTMESDLIISDGSAAIGTFHIDGGTFTGKRGLSIGNKGYGSCIVDSGVVTAGSTSYIGNSGGGNGSFIVNGGTVKIDSDFYIGYSGTATMIVNGGSMEISSEKWIHAGHGSSGNGTIILNGGVFKTQHIQGGAGASSLKFNGGTLMANNSSPDCLVTNLSVIVDVGGGTIDSGNFAIKILSDFTGSGSMVFCGGNTIILSGNMAYAGKTIVTPETTIHVSNATAKSNILSRGLVLAGLPEKDKPYIIFTCEENLTDDDLTNVSCAISDAFTTEIGEDGKSIVVTHTGNFKSGYYIGADGDLSKTENWSDGIVPVGINATIGWTANPILTTGSTFKPSSITFAADCNKTIIDGATLSGITAITNLSTASHIFNCAVNGDTIEFWNAKVRCEFWGGITLVHGKFGASFNGDNPLGLTGIWYFTGDWTPVSHNHIGDHGAASSRVTVAGTLYNPNNLTIGNGCVVTAANLKVTTSTYPAYGNNGRLVITGKMDISNTSKDFSLSRTDGENATVIADEIVYNTKKWPWLNAKKLVLGEGGIVFPETGSIWLRFSGTPTLYARDTITTLNAAKQGNQHFGINTGITLTICTTRFDTDDEPTTININGVISARHDTGNYTGGMAVTGLGKVVFNSASTFSGGLTVCDSATVAVNAGCLPGSGAVTLNDSSTFKVAESGTITLGGALTVGKNATLAFNFTDGQIAPQLVATSATLPDTLNVRISADENLMISGKEAGHILFSGIDFTDKKVNLIDPPEWVVSLVADESGNLVLKTKSNGLVISIR